ncbi:phosphate ABC transporter substrate-binding/OmpA family protein [Palleronia abyssalis]|uniref:Outer membrane porin F n=1 Tax=Palleronia abyssalis TaxID=1501240 RepID=A0A2R8BSV1_9RHOB|nr:phosphate ABC transporter substrate-binding/OmpA family protein [Palleronia abyssalis]SPJ23221.1 Outer membrane porin F [Palleronia abyssalis]
MRGLVRTIALLAGLAAMPTFADVTLRAGDTVVAKGELLDFDGRFYRILGEFGETTLDGRTLTCAGEDCPGPDAPERLRISGEGWIVDTVLPPVIETFAQREGYTLQISDEGATHVYDLLLNGKSAGRIELLPTTSAEGVADLIADVADFAVMLRPPTAPEAAMAREAGRGDLTRHERRAILGLDAIVPVVSALSPRTQFGPGWSVRVDPQDLHLPDPSTALGQLVLDAFPSLTGVGAIYYQDAGELSRAVAEDPDAIGLTLYSKIGNAQAVPFSGECGASIAATPETMKTEDYPYTVPILIYAPARRLSDLARDVIDYATSPVAQPVIRRAGLLDQFPESTSFAVQGDRLGLAISTAEDSAALPGLRRMVRDLRDRSRLSLSFRFTGGSSELDAQSQDNVARLARAIARGLFDGRDILFAGFTDRAGPSSANRALSRDRAEAVRDAVEAAVGPDVVPLAADGYGETLPIACDDTNWGKRVNRRVEVWIGAAAAKETPLPGN